MELIWWPIILYLLWSWEITVLMRLISTGEGWKKVKQSLLKLKSNLAKPQSFHQRQETDGWAQLQEELQLLWKNYPGLCCTPGQCCCCAQGLSSVPVHGWSHSPCSSGQCHFGRNLPGIFSQHCMLACFQNLLTVVEEKCIKYFIYVSESYISGVCCSSCPRELSLTSFAAAPHCPVSLLNSPFQSGQLCDKEFLYLGGLTEATREASGVCWGVVTSALCETEKERSSTMSLVCAQPLTQSQSDSQSLLLQKMTQCMFFIWPLQPWLLLFTWKMQIFRSLPEQICVIVI